MPARPPAPAGGPTPPVAPAEESGSAPAATAPSRGARVAAVGRSERELLALVNAERKAAGLRALSWHEEAARVARSHSHDMRGRRVVAHESPTTGSPGDRVRAAGIRAPLVLENVARAGTLAEVHAGLMNSPGHRANILSPEATHLGVGIVADSGRASGLYVTQVFLRVLRPFSVAAAREAVRRGLSARRHAAGASAARLDPVVERSAQALAEALAAARGNLPADRRKTLLAPAAEGYGVLRAVVGIVADPASVADDPSAVAPAVAAGIGVARGSHPELGENAAYVVVLLAAES